MKLDIKHCGNIRLVGYKITTTHATASQDIPALWDKLRQARAQGRLPQDIGDRPYAVYHDYNSQQIDKYTYFIGYAMEQPTISVLLDTELETAYVPRSRYAIFKTAGYFPERMLEVWQWIWKRGSLRNATHHTVEVYPWGYDLSSATEMEIWVNLEANTTSQDDLAELQQLVEVEQRLAA